MNSILSYFKSWQILVLAALLLTGLSSCKKNDDGPDAGKPVITGVTSLQNRSTLLEKAVLSHWILIKGDNLATTKKLSFGTVEVDMKEIFANDTSITVKIPGELADPEHNPIYVETKYGNATFDFTIVTPAPVVNSFAPLSGDAGEIVTITGAYLEGVSSVKFGQTEAEIVSKSKTQIEVKVPDGDSNGFLTLVSPGGTTVTSSAFGFKDIIYDESWNPLFAEWQGAWGASSSDDASTEKPKRGTRSIKISFGADWEGWQFTKSAGPSLSGYRSIKLSIWAPAGSTGKVVNLIVSQGWGAPKSLTLTGNQWNEFTVPLKDVGNPAVLNHLALQNTGNGPLVIYVDDIGLL